MGEGPSSFAVSLASLFPKDMFYSMLQSCNPTPAPVHSVRPSDVAFLFHTSGTSSSLPKPMPQTHHAAVCALPHHLPGGATAATFTTTPLYHGGIADCFRAWTSDALIYLFPSHILPITAANVCACLDVAATNSIAASAGDRACTLPLPPVKYFSSVPYVLQLLEADTSGKALDHLRRMNVVGVGGAALPAAVGDRLVAAGVRLASRYGSAECGFLLSSHRDYESDREWQYLRCGGPGKEHLRLESHGNGEVSELIVLPGWPHMAKTNRSDGSFATADLMAPHPTLPNAWRYHSRADSQLTLITGKKFDPAPLESTIVARSGNLLADALVFGTGRPFPGMLFFRSEHCAVMSDHELLTAVGVLVDELNRESQDHARIPRSMLVPMCCDLAALEKSSKGTVMRARAEEKYSDAIEAAYSKLSADDGPGIPDDAIGSFIVGLIEKVVPRPGALMGNTDLFDYGVDSVASMQIRYGLGRLMPKGPAALPLGIVEDCGTVERLSNFILNLRRGKPYEENENEHELMLTLVDRYSSFGHAQQAPSRLVTTTDGSDDRNVIVLTGATGALGAHILNVYRNSDSTSKIYCLVRSSDPHRVRERVDDTLIQKGLPGLAAGRSTGTPEVVVLQSRLGEPDLGLSEETYAELAAEATAIVHVAWTVNFRMRLRSFEKDNIAGLHNLLALALRSSRASPPFFVFCSSTATAANYHCHFSGTVPEGPLLEPRASSPLGYSRSKWVGERICQRASTTVLRLCNRIAVVRVGQLSGDSERGIWTAREAWPLLLSTARLVGCLPALRGVVLDWLPVDLAARAFVQLAGGMGDTRAAGTPEDEGDGGAMVFHVLNGHVRPDWMQLLSWLRKVEDIDVVEPWTWLARLEEKAPAFDQQDDRLHPAFKLLGLWKKAYGEESAGRRDRLVFAVDETKRIAPVLRDVEPVDESYFLKIWTWLQTVNMDPTTDRGPRQGTWRY